LQSTNFSEKSGKLGTKTLIDETYLKKLALHSSTKAKLGFGIESFGSLSNYL
jgi:hypothetical protein